MESCASSRVSQMQTSDPRAQGIITHRHCSGSWSRPQRRPQRRPKTVVNTTKCWTASASQQVSKCIAYLAPSSQSSLISHDVPGLKEWSTIHLWLSCLSTFIHTMTCTCCCRLFNVWGFFTNHSGTGGRSWRVETWLLWHLWQAPSDQLRACTEASHPVVSFVQRCASGIRSRPKRIICAFVWGSCAKPIASWLFSHSQGHTKTRRAAAALSEWLQTVASGLSYCSMNAAVLSAAPKLVMIGNANDLRYSFPRGPRNLRH